MSQWTEEGVKQLVSEASRRSAMDPEFRKLCLSDAKAALEKVAGKPIPDSLKPRFVEKEGSNLTIVLPDPLTAEEELSEEDLEAVAGGVTSGGVFFKYMQPVFNDFVKMPFDDTAFLKKPGA